MGSTHNDSSFKEMAAMKANSYSTQCLWECQQSAVATISELKVCLERLHFIISSSTTVMCSWRMMNGSCHDKDCMGGCGTAGDLAWKWQVSWNDKLFMKFSTGVHAISISF